MPTRDGHRTHVEARVYKQSWDPTHHLWLSALLAFLPLLTLLVLLGGLRLKAHWASLAALAVSFVVAITAYGMPLLTALNSGIYGAVRGVLLVLWITFNAIWIYNLTVDTGHFAVLRRAFARVSDDQRVQAIVIAFSFGALIEALAGGGSPVAICTVMLVAIGFNPIKAVVVALVADTAPVVFGGMGNPITALGSVTGMSPDKFAAMAGRQTSILAFLVPFILVYIADGRRGLRQAWPAALTAGASFAVAQFLFSMWNYRLCDIFAALVSAAAVMLLVRVWKPSESVQPETVLVAAGPPKTPAKVPATVGGGGDGAGTGDIEVAHRDSTADVVKAFAPYAIITLVFSLAQVTWGKFNINAFLGKFTYNYPWPGLHLLGSNGKDINKGCAADNAGCVLYNAPWLTTAGTLLFVSGLLTMLVLGIGPARALRVYGRTLRQFNWAIVTILLVFALAFVMQFSGQTATLGHYLASAGGLFAFLSPIVGWFGVAITGTDVGSNTLFGTVQTTAAAQIGASPILFGAANGSGGVLAKMISPQNLAIGAASIDQVGQEGTIFRRVIGWSVALLLLLCVLVYLQSTPILGWMVP